MDGHEQVGLTKSNATFLSSRLLRQGPGAMAGAGPGAGDWGTAGHTGHIAASAADDDAAAGGG